MSLDFIDFCTLGDSEQSWEALMHSVRESTNMHLTECREILFSIWFLLMLHRGFATFTQI